MNYKNYVKKELHKEFEKHCKVNSLDFYSCGCILTAHLVLEGLMRHKEESVNKDSKLSFVKESKCTPKEAWDSALEETGYHSGMSASATALIIVKFSPRGEEFAKWARESGKFMINWEEK